MSATIEAGIAVLGRTPRRPATKHALVIVTEWEQFRALDLKEIASVMARSVIADLRNIYSPEEVIRIGFHYCGVGRPKSLAY